MKTEFFFTADVGNTRAKVALWRVASTSGELSSGRVGEVCSDPTDAFETTEGWLNALPIDSALPCEWRVSSVAPRRAEELRRLVERIRPKDAFVLLKLADVPTPVRYDRPEKLGLDRVVAAFAGVNLIGKGVPFLIVDVGTAATIDFVDGRGVFRGGAILSGSRLAAKTLCDYTAALPMLDEPDKYDPSSGKSEPTFPATETNAAIRLGVFHSIIGAIAVFYWRTRRLVESEGGDSTKLAVLIAGGDAEATERLLRRYFDDLNACLDASTPTPEIVVAPGLVLQGAADLALADYRRNLERKSTRDS